MNKRSVLSLAALAVLALVSVAAVTGPARNLTAGKALDDSLAAAADTFSSVPLPSRMDSLNIWAANDSTVLYTVQIQIGGTWYTLDTTSVVLGTVGAVYSIPGQYAGMNWRLIADNATAATCYARQYIASFK